MMAAPASGAQAPRRQRHWTVSTTGVTAFCNADGAARGAAVAGVASGALATRAKPSNLSIIFMILSIFARTDPLWQGIAVEQQRVPVRDVPALLAIVLRCGSRPRVAGANASRPRRGWGA